MVACIKTVSMKNIATIIFFFILSFNAIGQKGTVPTKEDRIREYQTAIHAEKIRNNTKVSYQNKLYNYESIFIITKYDTTTSSLIVEQKSSPPESNSTKYRLIKFSGSKLCKSKIHHIDSLIAPYLFEQTKFEK